MIKSCCSHLFLVAIASVSLLLLFTIVNCNNNYDDNQMEKILFQKYFISTYPFDHFLEEEEKDNNNNNNNNDEDIDIFIRDALKPYPDRRSSFHAMRGKRRVI